MCEPQFLQATRSHSARATPSILDAHKVLLADRFGNRDFGFEISGPALPGVLCRRVIPLGDCAPNPSGGRARGGGCLDCRPAPIIGEWVPDGCLGKPGPLMGVLWHLATHHFHRSTRDRVRFFQGLTRRSNELCFRRIRAALFTGLKAGQSGQGSSPWSMHPQSHVQTSLARRQTHRLQRQRVARSSTRKPGRLGWRSI